MKRRLSAVLTALALTASLAGCQKGPAGPEELSASSWMPEESAVSSQETEALPLAEEDEPPLLSVKEYSLPSGFECTALSGDKAILINGRVKYYGAEFGEGNMMELDLSSGEIQELGIWADRGMVSPDGGTLYWVGMDEEPRYPSQFPEYVQAGIFREDRDGNGELVYKLSSWEDRQWKWNITQLAMGSSALVWAESWRFKDGEEGPSYHQRIQAMNLKTGEISTVAEWDAYDEIYRQLRADGDSLVYWESRRNEETSLHLYDLSAGEELLAQPVTGIYDAGCVGNQLIWC